MSHSDKEATTLSRSFRGLLGKMPTLLPHRM